VRWEAGQRGVACGASRPELPRARTRGFDIKPASLHALPHPNLHPSPHLHWPPPKRHTPARPHLYQSLRGLSTPLTPNPLQTHTPHLDQPPDWLPVRGHDVLLVRVHDAVALGAPVLVLGGGGWGADGRAGLVRRLGRGQAGRGGLIGAREGGAQGGQGGIGGGPRGRPLQHPCKSNPQNAPPTAQPPPKTPARPNPPVRPVAGAG
jgi:hypothetical protein